MARKKTESLKLGPERWGDRLRRAYYLSKQTYGGTWQELAERISQVRPVTDTTLMSYMKYESKPARMQQLQMAWLLCIAMRIDPADLDLNEADIDSQFLTSKAVRDQLVKPNPCFAISAA